MKTAVLAFLLLLMPSLASAKSSLTKIVDQVSASVVRIDGILDAELEHRYTCTGFVVSLNRVLTAAHCIGELMTVDGQAIDQVVKVDRSMDLAVVAVFSKKRPVIFDDRTLVRFEPVYGIGYAFGWTFLTTTIGAVENAAYAPTDEIAPGVIVFGIYIGGMSGGPVIDQHGHVVGMAQQTNDGIGYGVGALLMRAFLIGT